MVERIGLVAIAGVSRLFGAVAVAAFTSRRDRPIVHRMHGIDSRDPADRIVGVDMGVRRPPGRRLLRGWPCARCTCQGDGGRFCALRARTRPAMTADDDLAARRSRGRAPHAQTRRERPRRLHRRGSTCASVAHQAGERAGPTEPPPRPLSAPVIHHREWWCARGCPASRSPATRAGAWVRTEAIGEVAATPAPAVWVGDPRWVGIPRECSANELRTIRPARAPIQVTADAFGTGFTPGTYTAHREACARAGVSTGSRRAEGHRRPSRPGEGERRPRAPIGTPPR